MTLRTWSLLALAAVLLQPSHGAAEDGVVEINQARALAGGVTPGDVPGFPVTLSQPGSYILTGDLTLSDPNTRGVQITAGPVTLNLGGFGILGPTTCVNPGGGLECSPSGVGNGIDASGASRVTVRNGTIQGAGRHGALMSEMSRVEGVLVHSNGRVGILCGAACVVKNNLVRRNGEDGMNLGTRALVQDNVVNENHDIGIHVAGSSTVRGNTAGLNGSYGLLSADTAGPTGYGENVFTFNNGSQGALQVSGGVQIGTNVCGADTICPSAARATG